MVEPLSDYAYVGSPDVSKTRFAALLIAAGSPAANEAGLIWEALRRGGVRPLPFLAHWNRESGMGANLSSVEVRYQTRNPGAVRSVQSAETGGVVVVTDKGPFVRYPSYEAAAYDWALRLRGAKYAGSGLHTVRQVLPKYAPAADGNSPETYIRSVLGFISRHLQEEPTMQIIDRTGTPNKWAGRDGHAVRAVVVHITDGDTAEGAVSWFNNPESGVSAHYVYDGHARVVYRVVGEADTAWANGRLVKPDASLAVVRRWQATGINPNKETVSIEKVGRPANGWTATEVDDVRRLAHDICRRHGLTPGRETIIGHSQLDSVNRARCPSLEAFQWETLWEPDGESDPDDAKLEAAYQADKDCLENKRFAGILTRHFPGLGDFNGKVLVCDGGVLGIYRGEVHELISRVIDDWVIASERDGTLRRLG